MRRQLDDVLGFMGGDSFTVCMAAKNLTCWRSNHLCTRSSYRSMYKPTLFDRFGADAGNIVHAIAYGVMVFGLCIPLFAAASQKLEHPLSFGWTIPWVFACSLACAAITTGVALVVAGVAGNTWKHLTVDGSSTPYKEQYSYQQALVMRGQ